MCTSLLGSSLSELISLALICLFSNLGENLSVLSSNPADFKVSYAAAKAKYEALNSA